MRRVRTRKVQSLSRRQRELTPPDFAVYLVEAVRRRSGVMVVAALWVRHDSPYRAMTDVICYGVQEDAMTYRGPHPIVAHPPCGPWGPLAPLCKQSKEHGVRAMELVEACGGVVEQPMYSTLFARCAPPLTGSMEYVYQSDFGHPADKPTMLFWCDRKGG